MEPRIEFENATISEQVVVRGKATRWIMGAMAPQASGRSVWRRSVAGQSLVEFALSLPFLMALLLGLLEVGLLIRSHLTIIYATREGARSEAAAGSTPPLYWPLTSDAAQYYAMSDGDTVMVNNVNAALQTERANALFLSTYKADSTYGDPCQPMYASYATTNSDGTCSFTSSTYSNTNFTNWPVARYNPNNSIGGGGVRMQEIFQRASAPNYGFSRLLVDGSNNQNCLSTAPYYGTCGSNTSPSSNIPTSITTAMIAANPWYPFYRCDLDPSSPSTGQTGAAVQGGNSTYYNADANANGYPASRDWVGVRIDYKHQWLTGFFTGPLVLTDHSVYNLEPISLTNGNLTDCSKNS
jgi:Flp pilus assembly protein TadG